MKQAELKSFLDAKAAQYEHPKFLEADPIQIPHRFSKKEDIPLNPYFAQSSFLKNSQGIFIKIIIIKKCQ